MTGPRFKNTPLPVQGRHIGISGTIAGAQGDDNSPLMVSLNHFTFIPAVTVQSPASSPSKPSKGPGYFKKRKRESEGSKSQDVDDKVVKAD
jgi:hypothetical protein